MNEQLTEKLKYLRLPTILACWDDYLMLAAKKGFSHASFLTYILEEEYRIKRDNARILRLKRARIPHHLVIETFPFDRQPRLNKKEILALYDSSTYLTKNQNIIWLGTTGCGKTGLATSFLIHAINQGYTGRYVLFAELVNELYRSIADHSEQKTLQEYINLDCLLIDEIGYVEIEPNQVSLFFTLMQKRHQKRPTLLTSNLGFADWRSFLKSDHLTAALIDRLTENSHVINMHHCASLRSKLKYDE
jgi:DNA replication protein DnaC